MAKNEFKFLGISMEIISIIYGLILVLWAVAISLETQSSSLTSWIPAILGLPISIFGYLSVIIPSKKKLFMHIVVLFGVIVLFGGLDFIRGFLSPGGPFSNPYAGSSKLFLLVTGILFVFLCVKSFKWARKTNANETNNEITQ